MTLYKDRSKESKENSKEYHKYYNKSIKGKAISKLNSKIFLCSLDKCCSCGIINTGKNLDKHHFDYNKPLEYIILCKKCHMYYTHGFSRDFLDEKTFLKYLNILIKFSPNNYNFNKNNTKKDYIERELKTRKLLIERKERFKKYIESLIEKNKQCC